MERVVGAWVCWSLLWMTSEGRRALLVMRWSESWSWKLCSCAAGVCIAGAANDGARGLGIDRRREKARIMAMIANAGRLQQGETYRWG